MVVVTVDEGFLVLVQKDILVSVLEDKMGRGRE